MILRKPLINKSPHHHGCAKTLETIEFKIESPFGTSKVVNRKN